MVPSGSLSKMIKPVTVRVIIRDAKEKLQLIAMGNAHPLRPYLIRHPENLKRNLIKLGAFLRMCAVCTFSYFDKHEAYEKSCTWL